MNELAQKLQAYFKPDELEWRVARAGNTNGRVWAQLLVYVTSRAVMNRLDEVFGPEGWRNSIQYGPNGQVLCTIEAYIDGQWVGKMDGADETDVEAIKGGISGAMKRAGVQWGIGRYLYEFGDTFAIVNDKGRHRGQYKDGSAHVRFKYDIPDIPPRFMPGNEPWNTKERDVDEGRHAPDNPTYAKGEPDPSPDPPRAPARQQPAASFRRSMPRPGKPRQ